MKVLLCAGFLLLFALAKQSDAADLSIITSKGYVSYSVGEDWSLVTMQSKPPKTTAVFEIPRSTDREARGSARISLITFETDSSWAMAAYHDILGKTRAEVRQKTRYKQWEVYRRETEEGKVMKSTRFACRQISGVSVLVQLTWSHFRSSERDDSEMEAVLRAALDSVTSGLGPLPEREGGQVFRPL
jgi:hypothetical protein